MIDKLVTFITKYAILGIIMFVILSLITIITKSVLATIFYFILGVVCLIILKPITTYFITLFYNNK